MKRELFLLLICLSFVAVCFGQDAARPISDYLDKVGSWTMILAGMATTILTEVFNKATGSTKTNALIVSICMAIAVGLTLVMFGVPNVSMPSIFVIASGLFAVFRKSQQALQK